MEVEPRNGADTRSAEHPLRAACIDQSHQTGKRRSDGEARESRSPPRLPFARCVFTDPPR